MSVALRVLIVEDSEDDCQLILRELRRGGYDPGHLRVQTAAQLADALREGSWQIALSDYSMPGFSGLSVLKILREGAPELPCIIVSGAIGEDAAVNAIREGARDYVMKDRLTRLSVAVGQQMAESEARSARRQSEMQARRRTREIAALHAISAAVSRSLDIAVVVRAALIETLRALDAAGGAVILSEEGVEPAEPIVHEGFSREVLDELGLLVRIKRPDGRSAAPRIVRVAEEPHPAAAAAGWGMLMVIPIVISEGDVGALVAGVRPPQVFAAEMLSLAGGIGSQVGAAVENARLHERLQARTRYLETLQRINETLRSTLPAAEVLSIIAENAAKVLDAVSLIISIPDSSGQRLVVGAVYGPSVIRTARQLTGADTEKRTVSLNSGNPAARAFREGRAQEYLGGLEPVLEGMEPPVPKTLLPVLDEKVGSRAMAFLPLFAGNTTVGVMCIFLRRPRFSDAERSVLAGIADQAGLAVESARLFEETRRLRAFNQGIVEGVAEAILIHDQQGRITFANPAAEALLGYARRELLQRQWSSLFVEGNGPSGPSSLAAAGEVQRYETAVATRSGMAIPVIVSARPVRQEGQDAGTLSTITDISDRVRSERFLFALNRGSLAMAQAMTHEETFTAAAQALKEVGCACVLLFLSEDRRALVVRHASYGPETIDAALEAMRTSFQAFSVPLETIKDAWDRIVGHEVVTMDDPPAVLQGIFPHAAPAALKGILARFSFSTGIAAPLIVEGEVQGVLALVSSLARQWDVSAVAVFANHMAAVWHKIDVLLQLRTKLEELQRVQGQLLQAQKMEAIGRLAGGVAHDFNNQLTAIIGAAELLLEQFADNPPVRQEAEEILATAQRSAALTRQLLAFSRKQVTRPVLLSPDVLVRNMQRMLTRLIGEDVQLVLDLGTAPGSVLADPGQLEQVIMNLVVNARDAMPQGGNLRIATGVREVASTSEPPRPDAAPGRYVRISVTDTGTGMDAETRSHLFEPFFTTKPEGEGTGLGLATVYGIVQRCGGFIDVESRPGSGSTFAVALPLRAESAAEKQSSGGQSGPERGSETVLVVEDEPSVRSLVKRILTRGGFTVREAHSGDEGVAVAESMPGEIDLLLTDVIMPGALSSREMVERIVSRRPLIRILFISGYHDDAIARQGALQTAHGLLAKPFTSAQLLRAVREALDRR